MKVKRLSKIISMTLVMMLLFSISANCAELNTDAEEIGNESELVTNQRFISYDEAVSVIMNTRNVSEKEAMKIIKKATKEKTSKGEVSAEALIYMEFITNQSFGGGMTVEYGVLAHVDSYGSGRVFDSIISDWELAGSGKHTYTNAYRTNSIYSSYQLQDKARGQVEVAETYEDSAGVEAGIEEYVKIGFSVSSSYGYTVYYRKTQSFEKIYSLY